MVLVNKTQLKQVEYLIQQSLQGHHILFELDELRHILVSPSSEKRLPHDPKIDRLIEEMIQQPTIAGIREYLARLDQPTYQRVVRSYFSIVENNLFETKKVLH